MTHNKKIKLPTVPKVLPANVTIGLITVAAEAIECEVMPQAPLTAEWIKARKRQIQ